MRKMGKLFFIMPTNKYKRMIIRKPPICGFPQRIRQESSIDAKTSGWELVRKKWYLHSLEISPHRIHINSNFTVKKPDRHHFSQSDQSHQMTTNNGRNQNLHLLSCTELDFTSEVFPPKMHNLNLIMREYQRNLNWWIFCKTILWILQKC